MIFQTNAKIYNMLLFFGGILWISKRTGMLTFFPINSSSDFFEKTCHCFSGNQKICFRVHTVTRKHYLPAHELLKFSQTQ